MSRRARLQETKATMHHYIDGLLMMVLFIGTVATMTALNQLGRGLRIRICSRWVLSGWMLASAALVLIVLDDRPGDTGMLSRDTYNASCVCVLMAGCLCFVRAWRALHPHKYTVPLKVRKRLLL